MSPLHVGISEIIPNFLLYDCEPLPQNGTGEISLFTKPITSLSDPVPKTIEQTNLVLSGQLANPQRIQIRNLYIAIFDDRDHFVPLSEPTWTRSYAELFIGMRTQWRGPLWYKAHPYIVFNSLSLNTFLPEERRKIFSLIGNLRNIEKRTLVTEVAEPFGMRVKIREGYKGGKIFVGIEGLFLNAAVA